MNKWTNQSPDQFTVVVEEVMKRCEGEEDRASLVFFSNRCDSAVGLPIRMPFLQQSAGYDGSTEAMSLQTETVFYISNLISLGYKMCFRI